MPCARRPRSRCSRRRSTTTARSPTTTAARGRGSLGLPEAAVYGVSTFYDDLLVAARRAPRPRLHRHRVLRRDRRRARRRAARRRSGSGSASAREDGSVSLAETVCLGFCHSSPAVRDGDVVDAGPGAVERVLAGATPRRRRARVGERARRAGADRARRLVAGSSTRSRAHTPESLLEEVKAARVRGRGGAGFPAGDKWGFARAAAGEQKFIVANGDEGDPGSYIDKYLMERNPALVLEGMALAGYAVGAEHGFVLCRSEYPRSKPALEAAPRPTPARPACSARTSAAAASPSTSRSSRAPARTSSARRRRCWRASRACAAPSRRGRRSRRRAASTGMPTVVNNVETLATSRSSRATAPTPTRALSPGATPGHEARLLQRALRAPGVYEVRFGTPMRELCEDVAGGLRDGHDAQGAADRRPARRHPAGVAARHAVRLRRARRGRLHGRPRRHRRASTSARTCARSRATSCTSAPTRAAASASRAGSACAARTRCSRPTDAGRPRAARGAARGARARQPVRPRRRHAGADPQPARALPRRAGAGLMQRHDRRHRARGRARHDRARGDPRRRRRRADALLRRPPGAVRRLPRLPRRRRGRARADPGVHDAVPRRAWRSTRRTRPRGASSPRSSSSCSPSCRSRPQPHTELARSRAGSASEGQRWPGATHPVEHDERHPYLAFQHELCISCGRCVRACDEVQGAFALTATGRGFAANVTAGLDAGFRDSTCVSCGACADTCPTDAITEITLLKL